MNHIFKLGTFITLLFVVPVIMAKVKTAAPFNFDKAAFYAVMAGKNIDEVNSLLSHLKETAIPEKSAYEGALLMKKAGLLTKAKDKLKLFKSGRTKLEAAIKNDSGNIEYHFLRLIIQENAPKIVKYNGNLQRDVELVRTSFNKLAPAIQQAVKDYSKTSIFLKPNDF